MSFGFTRMPLSTPFPAPVLPAPAEVIGRIASIGPLAKCLQSAITELEEEDEGNHESDGKDFDAPMKEILLKRFRESVAERQWDETGSTGSSNIDDNAPPAGLLSGKLQYYNRVAGQWRIVLSDAELRPRIRCDDTDRVKSRISLWDYSAQNSSGNDGTVKLNNIVILAYDDL